MSFLENLKLKWDLSLISLIFTNIIVIIFAILQKWNFGVMILLYIIQSFIIGFFQFLKMLNKKNLEVSNSKFLYNLSLSNIKAAKNIMAIAYWHLYNSILFFYLLFAIGVSLIPSFICSKAELIAQFGFNSAICGQAIMTPTGWIYFGFSILIFFINHLISYIVNFKKDTEKPETIWRLIFMPYVRIVPIQMVAGFLSFFNPSMILFLLLKTIVDIYTHNYIHKVDEISEKYLSGENIKNKKIVSLYGVKSAPIILAMFVVFILINMLWVIAYLLLPILITALLKTKDEKSIGQPNENYDVGPGLSINLVKKSISLFLYAILIFIFIFIIGLVLFFIFVR